MKKLAFVAALAAIFTTGQAFAEDSKFNGFNVGLGVGFAGASTKVTAGVGGNPIPGFGLNLGESSVVSNLDLSYAFAANPNVSIGLGFTYDFNDTNSGSASYDSPEASVKGKEHYSVYIQPTFAVSKETAVFAKLSYHSMKGELSIPLISESWSNNLNGVGYGLGVKTFLTEKLYLQVEAQHIEYSTKTTHWSNDVFIDAPHELYFTPTVNVGIVTVGLAF